MISSTGYLDSPVAFPLSGATIAATAKKTLAGLAACFPQNLAGRIFELIIAEGHLYRHAADLHGHDRRHARRLRDSGTVNNATASSVAFAGDINDATMAGCVTARGMNASGYNPTAIRN